MTMHSAGMTLSSTPQIIRLSSTSHGRESLCRIQVPEDMPLRQGLDILNETGLQILFVLGNDGQLVGVITDGDVRRSLLRDASLHVALGEISNKDFLSLREGEIYTATDLIRKAPLTKLPVLDSHGKVTDVITSDAIFRQDTELSNVPVVVMAGGQGTRLSPLTRILPKPLMPVGEQTMLEKIMSTLATQGFCDFRVIISYKRELIKSYFSELGSPFDLEFIDEDSPLGTAGGLSLLKGRLNTSFVLTNCDIVAELQYSGLMEWHRDHNAHLTILGVRKRVDIPYGVIKIDENFRVVEIEEKPFYNNVIVSGIYVVDPEVLEVVPQGESLGMDGLIRLLIDRGMRVTCYPIESGWFDMGQFEEYRNLLKHFDSPDV